MKKNYLLLGVVSTFFLIQLLPEATGRFFDVNDSNLHQVIAKEMADRIAAWQNPLDFFSPAWVCGFPLFGHYQMLPHFVLAALHLLTFKAVSIPALYHLLVVALLTFYPWNYFFAAKRFGLPENAALAGAVMSLAVGSQIGFGHEFGSYLSYGTGLFPQLVGMTILPWTLALGRELLSGRSPRLFWPLISLVALLLAHIFVAYLALLILGLWWLLGLDGPRVPALKRLAAFAVVAVVAASFFIVPLLLNAPYHPESRYEPLSKLDSYGMAWVMTNFFRGRLFDAARWPLLTPLVALGCVVALLRRRSAEATLALGFLLSLLLFAGRTTWGALLDLLPMSADLHFERFILGVHFFGVAVAGVGVAWLYERAAAFKAPPMRYAAAAIGAILAVAILFGPYRFLSTNRGFVRSLQASYRADLPRVNSYFAALAKQPTTRVFPGGRNGWGNNFKIGGAPMYFVAGEEGVPLLGHNPFGWALPSDFCTWLDPFHWEQLDLFAVSHILSWRDDRYWGLTPVYADDPYAIYSTPAGQHLFGVVDTPFLVRADKHTYWNMVAIWLQSPLPAEGKFIRLAFSDIPDKAFDTVIRMSDRLHFSIRERTAAGEREAKRAIYDGPIRFESPAGIVGPPGTVSTETRRDPWTATVNLNRPAVAMLKMSFHPFWRATIDGQAAQPIMVSPGYVAVECPAGRHEIAFRYRPPWWKSALALLLFAAPTAVWFWDRKRVASADAAPEAPVHALRLTLIVLGVALVAYGALRLLPARFQRLEDLPPAGEAQRGDEAAGVHRRIMLGPVPFDAGLTVPLHRNGPNEKLYRLDGRFRVFEAFAGLNNVGVCDRQHWATFSVYADNQLVYQSTPQTPGGQPAYMIADLRGKKLLTLAVDNPDSPCKFEASWAEARLYR
jgi:hypothetical protein